MEYQPTRVTTVNRYALRKALRRRPRPRSPTQQPKWQFYVSFDNVCRQKVTKILTGNTVNVVTPK